MATGVILSLPHFMRGNGEIIIFGIIACVITIAVFYAWLSNICKSIQLLSQKNEGPSCLLIAIIWIPILTFCLIAIGAASDQWDMAEVGIVLTFFSAPVTLLIETIVIIVKKQRLKKLLAQWEEAKQQIEKATEIRTPIDVNGLVEENEDLKTRIEELEGRIEELEDR
ncbi:MAG: hypothetical protein E7073_04820 [Bacteroidales bacterium]|nr:hypothetical protein [Bacteroidales bacterium]